MYKCRSQSTRMEKLRRWQKIWSSTSQRILTWLLWSWGWCLENVFDKLLIKNSLLNFILFLVENRLFFWTNLKCLLLSFIERSEQQLKTWRMLWKQFDKLTFCEKETNILQHHTFVKEKPFKTIWHFYLISFSKLDPHNPSSIFW